MRILQVSHGFPPEQVGGTESYTSYVAHALYARGQEVWVFTRTVNWHRPEYEVHEQHSDGLCVFRINNTERACTSFEETYHHRALARRFGELLDWLRPDVVHIQHLVHLSTHLPDEAQKRGIPVVMTFLDYWLLCNQGQLLRRDRSICTQAIAGACFDCADFWPERVSPARHALELFQRGWHSLRHRTCSLLRSTHCHLLLVPRQSTQQALIAHRMQLRREEMVRLGTSVEVGLVWSQLLRGHLVAFGLPAERLVLLSPGIPPHPGASHTGAHQGVLRVAYLGRIIPAKGVDLLLEAAERLCRMDIQIDIHGAPPHGATNYVKRMRHRAAQIPRVRWHGGYEPPSLHAILANTDVIVVPSIWYETGPLVILEAFAARTPVVATDLGNIRELVRHEENGLLFPRGDAQALAECLARLADDRALLERLQEGIGLVKPIDVHAQELEAIYASVLSNPDVHRARRSR